MDTRAIQSRLSELGFDPGPIDGILGPKTRVAVAAFQKDRGLDIQWPGTVGPKTLAALFEFGPPHQPQPALVFAPWIDLALQKKGLHETDPVLKKFLKSDSKTVGDPAKIPWCGDLVSTCIALTCPNEPQPSNPYLARNWLKFGVEVKDPVRGAVAVFWRGSRNGVYGHVGFVGAHSKTRLLIVGGNQSDAITEAQLDKERLLGLRWPSTVPLPNARLPVLATLTGAHSRNEV